MNISRRGFLKSSAAFIASSSFDLPMYKSLIRYYDGATLLNSLTQTVTNGDVIDLPDENILGFPSAGWFVTGSGELFSGQYTVTGNTDFYAAKIIEISAAEQLDNVRYNLAGFYRLTKDISLSSYCNWMPIGTDKRPFSGRFYGNGHIVSDLKINRKTEKPVGLFGHIKYGRITDLVLQNVDIEGGQFTGGIVGELEGSWGGFPLNEQELAVIDGLIMNCYVDGNIRAFSDDYNIGYIGIVAGGVVGYSMGTLSNCHSKAIVSSFSHKSDSLSGGIAGYSGCSVIEKCHWSGTVYSSGHNAYSGGITGVADFGILNCSSIGHIYSTSSGASSYSGGIAGYLNDFSVLNCQSAGNISSISYPRYYSFSNLPEPSYAGGIVGYSGGNVTEFRACSIQNCCSSGNIAAHSSLSGSYSGAITGDMKDTEINNCISTENITPPSPLDTEENV
ncbi:MAG: hypothetical protein LBH05_03245 [Deferribacteraceae bacterium]|jgi:hypothetical protein|nr:hypothetical protein [Deferribacteraceae bacterium]